MGKNLIKAFAFHNLKLGELFDLVKNLLAKALHADVAEALGLGEPYNETKESFDRLVEIFLRNPAMEQTEDVTELITKIRKKMTVVKTTLEEMVDDATGEQHQDARTLEYIARPYLKGLYNNTMANVIAKAGEMADALRTTGTLPKLVALGLKPIVDNIAALAVEANNMLILRGEEAAFKKALGTATKVRNTLEQQLKFLLNSTIPAYYANATGDLAEKFKVAILEINGTLDIYRHLTKGESKKSGSGGGGGGVPVDPSKPDTGAITPPEDDYNGGTYIDPNA
jgi:hypothetical protein